MQKSWPHDDLEIGPKEMVKSSQLDRKLDVLTVSVVVIWYSSWMLKQNIFEFRKNVRICKKNLTFPNIKTDNSIYHPFCTTVWLLWLYFDFKMILLNLQHVFFFLPSILS